MDGWLFGGLLGGVGGLIDRVTDQFVCFLTLEINSAAGNHGGKSRVVKRMNGRCGGV